MNSRIKNGFCSVLLISAIGLPVSGQKSLVLIPAESKVVIEGTSSLHDWEEKVERFEVTLQLKSQGADIEGISKVTFLARALSVVSDNSLMTGKTHEALQAEKHPEIAFRSTEPASLRMKGNGFAGSVAGDLVLNGVTRRIVIDFSGTTSGDRIEISGSQWVSMAEFNIKPPTAMLGTLKTGDKVKVSFLLRFKI